MITQFSRSSRFFLAAVACFVSFGIASRQLAAQGLGYGVSADGTLFRFDLSDPDLSNAGSATTIGVLSGGVVPEGIDFRPTTTAGDVNRPLYAIDVGPVTTQLYIVNTSTAALTPVGAGFPSTVAGSYDLTTSSRFGFDFNPGTLQPDGSVRIRLISTSGVNLRLNSDTGVVATVDTPLLISTGASPFADAAAYINSNVAVAAGTTTLYDMDSRNDALYTQLPPNAGTLNFVGNFGVTIDANAGIGFDILAPANDADTSGANERAYAAFTRDATQNGAYLLYQVNLASGATTQGVLVDGGRNFAGGLALTYSVPEPTTLGAAWAAAVALVAMARRRA